MTRVNAAALLVCLALGATGGFLVRDHFADKDAADASAELLACQTAAKTAAPKALEASNKVAAATEQKLDQVRSNTGEIVRKVPVYVPVQADRSDRISTGLARLHDEAATGVPGPADAASGSYEAPSGFTSSDLAFAIAFNYGRYHECAEQLTGLQDWNTAQFEAYQKGIRK